MPLGAGYGQGMDPLLEAFIMAHGIVDTEVAAFPPPQGDAYYTIVDVRELVQDEVITRICAWLDDGDYVRAWLAKRIRESEWL